MKIFVTKISLKIRYYFITTDIFLLTGKVLCDPRISFAVFATASNLPVTSLE